MENTTTEAFCHKFRACAEGARFARKFKTMRDCYSSLLSGEAGDHSAEWAIWVATRPGVMSDRDLRLFAVKCARRVQHLMKDKRSLDALDVAERYSNGEATDEELAAARAAAFAAAFAADRKAAHTAARDSAEATAWDAPSVYASVSARAAACAVAYAATRNVTWTAAWATARGSERREQLKILSEFGNQFEN